MSPNEAARNFWSQQDNFPFSIKIFGIDVMMMNQSYIDYTRAHVAPYFDLSENQLAIDIGGGSSTHLYFDERTVEQFYVLDFEPLPMSRSAIPEDRRFVMDIGADMIPEDLKGVFTHAFMGFTSRYIPYSDRRNAYRNVHTLLKPGGLFVLADFSSANIFLADKMGQVDDFNPRDEALFLAESGFYVEHTEPPLYGYYPEDPDSQEAHTFILVARAM